MKRCERCCRAGDSQEDIQGGCVDKQTIGCPTPVPVVPGKDIVLACRAEPCGKVVSFPAARVMSRSVPTEVSCMFAPCAIATITPEAEAAPAPQKNAGRGKSKG